MATEWDRGTLAVETGGARSRMAALLFVDPAERPLAMDAADAADGPRRWFHSPSAIAVLVSVIGSLLWLAATPHVPDLAAQVARTQLVDQVGVTPWWTGWFGGVTLPDYSVIGPWLMAVLGVRGAGVLAAVAGALAFARLSERSLRPRAAAAAFAVASLADVVDGRITFAIGLATGAWTAFALRDLPAAGGDARRWRQVLVLVGSVLTYLASPLAGLFLGLALVAVVVTDRQRRGAALVGAGVLVVLAAGSAVLFPSTGVMPFHPTDIIPAGLGSLGVLLLCSNRTVRAGAALVLAMSLVLLAVPSAVGTNITRITWVAAAALVLAWCRLRAVPAVVLALALAIWPVADLVRQISRAESPSAAAEFYAPLSGALEDAGADPASGQRLEIVDSGDHWAVAYLPQAPALARGWDRQADAADNPIFYRPGALTADSYRQWLRQLAVSWVAVPNVKHDYAAVAEAALIARGLPYLDAVWSSPDWTLYRVADPAPLADGARVNAVDASGVTLSADAAATVRLRVRWTAYLTVETVRGDPARGACLRDDGGWATLSLPRSGTYRVVARVSPLAPLFRAGRCVN